MLEAVFTKILQMSLMGCYSIGLVLAVRLLLMRCGRVYAYYLWVLVFVCLCLPVSLPGNYSLIPERVAEFSRLGPAGQEAVFADSPDLQEPEQILEPHSLPVLTEHLSDRQQYKSGEADALDDTRFHGKESGSDRILVGSESERDRILPEDGSKLAGILSGDGNKPAGILAGDGSGLDGVLTGEGSGSDRILIREESESDKISAGTDIRGQQIRKNVSMADWKRAAQIWLLGVVMLTIGIVFSVFLMSFRCSSYRRLGRKQEANIVEADGLPSPFLWGFLRPVIYLPSGMEGQEREYILAHEMVHRNRKDHLVRVFILAVTVLHWFNPLVWLAYSLCSRDMEISCDEAVLDRSEKNIRKAYAESLLKYAARQNRYIISPLGFGEPSVRSRIKNVLRHKKKSAWISAVAGLCVVGIATGLLHYPAGDKAAVRNEIPDNRITEAEPLPEDAQAGLVVNNGGEIIGIAGEHYYLDGVPLYSDGTRIYISDKGDDGNWHIYRYETDGSAYLRILDGRIVDSTEYGQVLYCMFPAEDRETECMGWYDTGTGESGRFSQEDVCYLGKDGGYLYVSRQETDGLHLDRIREIDLTEEKDLLKEAIPAEVIVAFSADESRKRLVFAAEGPEKSADLKWYSYQMESGVLVSKELTGLKDFAMMDGSVYFQRYRSRTDHTMVLLRTDYDLSVEEQIGEGLRLLKENRETHTLLVEKKTEHPDYGPVSSLVRLLPEEKEEQMLLDMRQMLPSTGEQISVDDIYLDLDFHAGDDLAYEELNMLEEKLYVTVHHLSRRSAEAEVQKNMFPESVRLTVNRQGEIGIWEPERMTPGWEDASWQTEPVVGQPVDLEKTGWDPEHAVDMQGHFDELPTEPDASEKRHTYLLNKTEYWTLYGKGDYKSMLLDRNGRYTQIDYPYMSSYQMCPELMEANLDRDIVTELAVLLHIKHGTGVYIDTLLVADFHDNASWVYQFTEADMTEQLMRHITSERTEQGLQAYIDGEPAGSVMEDEEGGRRFQTVEVGQQIRFSFEEEQRIRVCADLEFYDRESSIMTAEYNGSSITADVIWTGDHFTLRNISCLEPENGPVAETAD